MQHHQFRASGIQREANAPVTNSQPELADVALQRFHVAVTILREAINRGDDASAYADVQAVQFPSRPSLPRRPRDSLIVVQHTALDVFVVYHAARTHIRPRFLNESFLGVGDGLVIERSVIECNQSRMALFHRAAARTVVGHAYTFGPTAAKVKRPRKTAANHRTPRGVLRNPGTA